MAESTVMAPATELDDLLDHLFLEFIVAGSWPSTTAVEIAFRARGSAKRMIFESASGIAVWDWGADDPRCYLTLRGLAGRTHAAGLITDFLSCLRYLATRYVATRGLTRVSEVEFSELLGLSPVRAQCVSELLRREPELFSSYTRPPNAPLVFVPSRVFTRLETVSSLAEYWQIHDQFEADERAAAFAAHTRTAHSEPMVSTTQPRTSLIATLAKRLDVEKSERGTLWGAVGALLALGLTVLGLILT